MFSPSSRCKIPNINIDTLRDELFDAEVVTRFGIKSEAQFKAWLRAQNERLAARSNDEWVASRPTRGRGSQGTLATFKKALAKAREHNFFLGMDYTWLDDTG